jgi:hypothetical protein
MRRPHAIVVALLSAAPGACSSSGLPSLSAAPPTATPAPFETGAVPIAPTSASAAPETTIVASGTPTEIYSLVARNALRCWFGANGPLKATHIFGAEAAPPSEGGTTEIVLQERDPTLRDQRGARAFRVAFVAQGGSVLVGITPLKVAAPLSELMVQDVETWARGGGGCQARAVSPPVEAAPPPAAVKSGKGKPTQNSRP